MAVAAFVITCPADVGVGTLDVVTGAVVVEVVVGATVVVGCDGLIETGDDVVEPIELVAVRVTLYWWPLTRPAKSIRPPDATGTD